MRSGAFPTTVVIDRQKTIEELMPVIKHLAYKLSYGFDDDMLIDDLVSAGVMGLLESLDRYDPRKNIKLNTFAYWRIRGAMIDELRRRDWIPKNTRSKAKKITEAVRDLESRLGRYPEEAEVAQELGVNLEDYLTMLKEFGTLTILSVDELAEKTGLPPDEVTGYAMEEETDPEQRAELRDIERMLGKEIEKLSERQRQVLTFYYYEDMNMKEIAELLNITESRVSQIHSQALLNLRARFKRPQE
ncbi:MAG TPA: FliA/WhiG family RNA polymerase sigma factor [Syntrophorhabdales bacterium]|nr:FliA/WhiG family RNA polymerase sigma factor [Syntrophorhabdales bacterium]